MKTVRVADFPGLVGQEVGVSSWITIDQGRIDTFAEATGDSQWIHVDPERAARELPTKCTIAHGYLTLALISVVADEVLKIQDAHTVVNYGSNKVRFPNIVPVNSRVRGRQEIKSARERNGVMQVVSKFTIEIENQTRPACVAEVLSLVYGPAAKTASED